MNQDSSEFNQAEMHYNRGIVLYDLCRYEQAEKEFQQCILQDPYHFSCLYALSTLYLASKPNEALKLAEILAGYYPDHHESYYQLARAYFYNRKNKETLKYCYIALSYAPESAKTQLLLTEAYLDDGQRNKASEILERCLQSEPENSEALILKLKLLESEPHKTQEAALTIGMLLRLNPDSSMVHAKIAHYKGQKTSTVKEAFHYYETALRLDPQNGFARFAYSELLREYKTGNKNPGHLFGIELQRKDIAVLSLAVLFSLGMISVFVNMTRLKREQHDLVPAWLFFLIILFLVTVFSLSQVYLYFKYITRKNPRLNPFAAPVDATSEALTRRTGLAGFFTINRFHNLKVILLSCLIVVLCMFALFIKTDNVYLRGLVSMCAMTVMICGIGYPFLAFKFNQQ